MKPAPPVTITVSGAGCCGVLDLLIREARVAGCLLVKRRFWFGGFGGLTFNYALADGSKFGHLRAGSTEGNRIGRR